MSTLWIREGPSTLLGGTSIEFRKCGAIKTGTGVDGFAFTHVADLNEQAVVVTKVRLERANSRAAVDRHVALCGLGSNARDGLIRGQRLAVDTLISLLGFFQREEHQSQLGEALREFGLDGG